MEFEKYIVKVNLDDSRSHISGLLPYVDEDGLIHHVNPGDENGNWGKFMCDLVICTATPTTNALGGYVSDGPKEKGASGFKQVHRMKAIEILRRYFDICKMLENGIRCKVVNKKVEDYSSPISAAVREGCSYVPERGTTTKKCLSSVFDLDDAPETVYGYRPLASSGFSSTEKGIYSPMLQSSMDGISAGDFVILVEEPYMLDAANMWWKNWSGWTESSTDLDERFPNPMENGEYNAYTYVKTVERYIIGKERVPENIDGIKVPNYVHFSDIKRLLNWFNKSAALLDDDSIKKEWDDMGGESFRSFLNELSASTKWILTHDSDYDKPMSAFIGTTVTDFKYSVPKITIPISLDTEVIDGGVYEVDAEHSGNCEYTTVWHSDSGLSEYAESKLDRVIDDDATEVGGVTGVWKSYPDSANVFSCKYVSSLSSWTISSASTKMCGDGEDLRPGQEKYRTITTVDCIKNVVPNPSNNDVYYFMIKKDNRSGSTFGIPYTSGVTHNIVEIAEDELYLVDYISSITLTSSSCTIDYVIGAKASGGTKYSNVVSGGVKYEETFPYHPNQVMTTCLDGFDGVKVYYDEIDTESTKVDVYSSDYNLWRKTNIAKVVGMEVLSGYCSGACIFTRDGSSSFIDDPKKVIDISINRGAAAAFESHFKLSECNTFDDLKKYGNNFYNL